MKKLPKFLLLFALVVVVLAGAALGYLFARYPAVPPAETVSIQATPQLLAQGEYLVNHVTGCIGCHSVRDLTKYGGPVTPGTEGAGNEPFGDPAQGLVLFSKNITPEAIGSWSDGELMRAIASGVNAGGEALFPIMPYPNYARMARPDLEAIVAYIRTLKPVRSSVPERRLPFPLPLVVRTLPAPAELRAAPPSRDDRQAYGEYLATIASCQDCHSPMDAQGARIAGREFSGGMEFPLPGGGIVRAANISPDADTGLGTWTEEEFVAKFQAWRSTEPRALTAAEQRENTTMPWLFYSGMTDEDLRAIYGYLRTAKPVVNRVRKFN